MIVGTAGHVDHGKTALVKALTGIDTDRLPEEKRRGITLELGFAHLDLPGGRRVGVIDVPGHERFVKAMAAGAGGVDVAVLVIAADEGVMPQTREHVDICGLLGVRVGLVVLTKADLLPTLDAGWLDLLEAEVAALVKGSCFEGGPVLQVSAKTGQGLEALKNELARRCDRVGEGRQVLAGGPLFVPVDRAFTLKGFGVVVTGTVASGRVRVGDEVGLVPGHLGPLRVRGLQVHGGPAAEASAGTRVALNLPELAMSQVHRGHAVVHGGDFPEARALDVELTLLPAAVDGFNPRTHGLVTLGTAQVECVVRLLDVARLEPGQTCFAQIRCRTGVAAFVGQRFILRGTRVLPGRGATLAGGRVLTVNPPRRRRGAAEHLAQLASAPLDDRVRWVLSEAGSKGLTVAQLLMRVVAPETTVLHSLEGLSSRRDVLLVDKEARRYVDARVVEALSGRTQRLLEAFHREHPEREGMPLEELRQRVGQVPERTFHRLMGHLEGQVEVDGELVRLPGRGRRFDEATRALKRAVMERLERDGLGPLFVADLAVRVDSTEVRVRELLQVLVAEGAVTHAGGLFFAGSAVKALEARVREHFAKHAKLTTQQFKELVGKSRKYVIPLAEYLDRERVTLRVGDDRVLRTRSNA